MNHFKKLWESKTFWMNVCAIGILIGTELCGYQQYAEAGGIILAAANIGLRLLTNQPIGWTVKD